MRKILIAILISLLLISPFNHSYAQNLKPPASGEKQEVVYAKLAHDGAIDSLSVVNVFRLEQPGRIIDYGQYAEVVNLTNLEEFFIRDDKIMVKADAGVFYYQGKSPDKALPWIIELKYLLDGQVISAEELAGQSGELELVASVKPNPEADPTFFENYLLQISFQFPQDHFKLLEATGATEAISGEDKLLTFMLLPKKSGEFRIKAQVNDFAMKPVMFNGLPFDMAIELPDMDDSLGELKLLQSAIAQLNSGAQSLAGGLDQANSGGSQLLGGANLLADSTGQMSGGYAALHSGLAQYQAGMDQYAVGVEQFHGGINQLFHGIDELVAGINRYSNEAVPGFRDQGLVPYVDGVEQYAGGVNQLLDGLIPMVNLVDGVLSRLEGIVDLQGSVAAIKAASDQIARALQSLVQILDQMEFSSIEELKAQSTRLREFLENIESQGGALPSLRPTIESLQAVAANLSQNIAAIREVAHNIYAAADQVEDPVIAENLRAQAARLVAIADDLEAQSLAPLYSIIAQLEAVEAVLQQLLNNLSGLGAIYAPVDDLIQAIDSAQLEQLKQQIQAASEHYAQLNAQLHQYLDEMEQQLPGGFGDLTEQIRTAKAGMQQLRAAGDSIIEGGDQLIAGYAQAIQDPSRFIAEGANRLVQSGIGPLRVGSDEIVGGVRSLAYNLRQITSGSAQIGSGLQQLSGGLADYRDGIASYVSGIAQAGDGSKQLAAGTDRLAKETEGMDEQMKAKIEEMTSEMLPGDFTPVSFVSAKNKSIDVVQFVIMGQGINLPEAEAKAVVEPEEKSIWDRIRELFE